MEQFWSRRPTHTAKLKAARRLAKSGRANSHRAYAAYMIRLESNDREVFATAAGLDASPLVDVAGRDYDIRIPLETMGIVDSRATRMTIGDAEWPTSAVVSVAVQRYP